MHKICYYEYLKNNQARHFDLRFKFPSEFTCGMCKSLSNVFIPVSHSEKLSYCEEKFLDDFNHIPMETVISDLLQNLKNPKSAMIEEKPKGQKSKSRVLKKKAKEISDDFFSTITSLAMTSNWKFGDEFSINCLESCFVSAV